jgi:hypothetical protein
METAASHNMLSGYILRVACSECGCAMRVFEETKWRMKKIKYLTCETPRCANFEKHFTPPMVELRLQE